MDTPTIQRPLTDSEMATVIDTMTTADTYERSIIGAVFGVMNALLADEGLSIDDFTANDRLNPSRLGLPRPQWHELAEKIVEHIRDNYGDLKASNAAMDWINVGPSAYDEEGAA